MRLVAAAVVICCAFCSVAVRGDTVTLDYTWSPNYWTANDLSWTFNLQSLGLDLNAITISSASVEFWANGVDTNADMPASYQTPLTFTGQEADLDEWYTQSLYYVSGNLTDTLTSEEGSGSSTVTRGNGVTSIFLSSGATGDFSYLRDGTLGMSLDVQEASGWYTSYNGYSTTSQYIYWHPSYGNVYRYERHHYYSMYAYTGDLNPVRSRLTLDYTPAQLPPAVVPAPLAATMAGLGFGVLSLKRLVRSRKSHTKLPVNRAN